MVLLHLVLLNCETLSESLVSDLESFLLGKARAGEDSIEEGIGIDGATSDLACLERLLWMSVDEKDRNGFAKNEDLSQTEILHLSRSSLFLDAQAVHSLLAVTGGLEDEGNSVKPLLEVCQALLEKLFAAETVECRDTVTTVSVFRSASLFYMHLYEASLAGIGAGEAQGEDVEESSPTLRYLLLLRTRVHAWVLGGMELGSGPAVRQIVTAAKSLLEDSSGGEERADSMSLVCLDALVNLLRLVLVDLEKKRLLEEVEAVVELIPECLSMVLMCLSTNARGLEDVSSVDATLCEAASAAGLPVDVGEGGCFLQLDEAERVQNASSEFCALELKHKGEMAGAMQQWDAQVQTSLLQSFSEGGMEKRKMRISVGLACRLTRLTTLLCSNLQISNDLTKDSQSDSNSVGEGADDGGMDGINSILRTCLERLLVVLADVATDERLEFLREECAESLKALASSEDTQVLLDLSRLRRVDLFLQAVAAQNLCSSELGPASAIWVGERVNRVFAHCISAVRTMMSDTKRNSALLLFYLEPQKRAGGGGGSRSISTSERERVVAWVSDTVDKTDKTSSSYGSLPPLVEDEGMPGKGKSGTRGNVELLLHMLFRSSDARIIRDVLRLFGSLLEKPTSTTLARLKPYVRRNVAESLAVLGRAQLRALLGKLLLFRHMNPAGTVSQNLDNNGQALPAVPPTISPSSATPPANAARVGDVPDSMVTAESGSAEATVQRRETLRLLTQVLDGVDESLDTFAGELVEALLEFIPDLIRMPRPILKECFAGIKFVCFRQSQASVERMIDVLLEALTKAANNPATPPEAAANLADMIAGLVASFQSVSRQPFSDLGSVTSAHVRASDTLSTVSTSSEMSNEGMSYTSRGESTVATSAVTYISSTGHMDQDDASAVGSHMDCASLDMDEDAAASMDDEEEMLRERQGLLDEQQMSAEEEERRLASKVCSYTKTSNTFSEQHWYHCWTCGLTFQEGCCAVCAKVCHRGHDITYSRYSRFFCDCGAGKQAGHTCQALHPRDPDAALAAAGLAPHGAEDAAESCTRCPGQAENDARGQEGEKVEEEVDISAWLADCEKLPSQLTRQARDTLLQKLRGCHVSSVLTALYDSMMVQIDQRDGVVARHGPCALALKDLKTVHSRDVSKGVPCLLRRSIKPGSFGQHPSARQSSLSPARPARSLVPPDAGSDLEASGRGLGSRGAQAVLSVSTDGMLAVAQEDGLEVLDARKKMVDASTVVLGLDKASIKSLSKTALSFEPQRVLFNPSCPHHLAAAGKQHCCVLTLNSLGKVTNVVSVELSLEALGSNVGILDIFWLPDSEVCLAVVTDAVVNIYDLSVDVICPIHSLRHPSGATLCAAAPYADTSGIGVLLMLQSGHLFRFPLDAQSKARTGPCDVELEVHTPKSMQGEASAGQAVFYSLKSHLLVCVYGHSVTGELNGVGQRIVLARLAPGATKILDWVLVDLNASSENAGAIDTFVDVGIGWGQVLLASSATGAYALLQVSSEIVRVLWLHTPPCGTSVAIRVRGVAASSWTRPSLAGMMVLLEDGSLQHWAIREQQGLRQPDLLLSSSLQDSGKVDKRGADVTFPVDFFEKGVSITSKISLSGDNVTRTPASDSVRKHAASAAAAAAGDQAVSPVQVAHEPILSPHLDHLRIVVQNPNAEMCVIGVLVLVGDALPANIPTELHVHDRVIETQAGVKRWYSLPLTNEEVLLSDKELVLSTTSSHTAGNAPAIDQIEVFGMRKDKFGWADKQRRAVQLASAKERRLKNMQTKRPTVRGLDCTEKAAMSLMNALAMHWSVGGLQSLERECRTCREKFMAELPKHLLHQVCVPFRECRSMCFVPCV